jgi:parvulin-like peptidyl-prolyl isomerase
LKATTKALIAGLVAVVASVGLIFWQAKYGGAHGAGLTQEDLSLIAESMQPQVRASLASDPEDRKKLAGELRELLAMAEEARAHGVADRPEVRRQLDLMRNFLLAQTYAQSQREAGKPAAELYTKEEVEAYLKESGNEERFNQLIADVKKLNPEEPANEIPEQQKQQLKQQWGAGQVLARKAIAAGADKDRKTQLQVRLQQANLLSKLYSDELVKKIAPTDKEIDEYFVNNPDQDPKKAREKAEGILKRAKAGEDFEALAKEFSDEPGAKERGGELPWFGRTEMVKPFSDAAFAMKEGEISDIVETQFGYHIIKVTGRRTDKNAAGEAEEQVQARHILIKPTTANANPFAPPVAPREAAKNAILEEKRKQIVKEIVERRKVNVPDDFPVKPPEQPVQPPMSPHGEVELPPGAENPEPRPEAKGGSGEAGKSARPKSGKDK